jgi:hypothetical protein
MRQIAKLDGFQASPENVSFGRKRDMHTMPMG